MAWKIVCVKEVEGTGSFETVESKRTENVFMEIKIKRWNVDQLRPLVKTRDKE